MKRAKWILSIPFEKDLKEIKWFDIGGTLLLSIAFVLFFLLSDSIWIFNLLVIPAVLMGFRWYPKLSHTRQRLVAYLYIAVIVTYSLRIILSVYRNVLNPPQWDFQLFWVYGQVGAHLLNPYDPNVLLKFALPLHPSADLLKELYFYQLPPLIFLFLPLGWFDIHVAALVWSIFLVIILILDIQLLWSLFFDRRGFRSLVFVIVLVLMLESTRDTLLFTQTNFIVLLAFLLYWRKRKSLVGGIWLGIGMLVKPIFVFVLIYPVVKRHWRAIFGMITALLSASILTIIAFGPGMFFGYLTDNPIVHEMPNYMYVESVNQSLLATILRLTNFDFASGSPYLQPLFIACSFLLAGVTGFLLVREKPGQRVFSAYDMSLVITFALLLFPKTLMHYAMLLIIPLLTISICIEEFESGFWYFLVFMTCECVLVSLGESFIFAAILLAWLFIVGIFLWTIKRRPGLQRPDYSGSR